MSLSRSTVITTAAAAAAAGVYLAYSVAAEIIDPIPALSERLDAVVRLTIAIFILVCAILYGTRTVVSAVARNTRAVREDIRQMREHADRQRVEAKAKVARALREEVARVAPTPDEIAHRVVIALPTAEQMFAHAARIIPTAEQIAAAMIKAMPQPAPQRVYVSRAEVTAELPPVRSDIVDPDVIHLGARLTDRLRRERDN